MPKLRDIAESAAEDYVKYALGERPNAEEAFSAKEDFIAGYVTAGEKYSVVVELCRKQLLFIEQTAADHEETNALALIRYLIERLR